ncbi:phosphoribosylamine--glycine ligase [Candidatus Peribacteria bacterium RIFCSPHIGHO2_01_FULL_51_9]|nr:MAG: phosphoribosylamine--glycine ligase [Candidatus Peribacteria bacterium RIFCSPHIGHO2_01_FULL_51_9]
MQTTTPKKFLFVSITGLISDIAWQVVKEGHEAKYFIADAEEKEVGDGFVPKVTDWEKEVDWADTIVFDDTLGHGVKAQELRQRGKFVVGGTPYTDRLEDDRSFGQEELKNHGISILPYQQFDNFDDGIAYVQQNPGKYVLKPCGGLKQLLFVGNEDDGGDVIRVLTAYKHAWRKEVKLYQLQKRVVGGVEVAVGAFFDGQKFIDPINVNFEHKKLFPGELGVSTGEMGTSMFWSGPNKLFNSTLKKIEPALQRERYVGYIDINCIVNGNGIYPLEFTCRFGYPTISIQYDGIMGSIGDFFHALARGEPYKLHTKKGFQVGARIVVPPFPFDDKKTFDSFSRDAAIVFKRPVPEGVHIEDVKLVNGEWIVTGTSGVVLIVTGTGSTMKEAQKQMYSRIGNILISNMYYRTDIGDRWFEDSDKLHSWGYLRES